ncbi:MAG TPA: hypothetical protein VMV53_12230 [Acidimicrobiales bacterium]|nr:hypothetical protein [Acidimicrobiales bacterium]
MAPAAFMAGPASAGGGTGIKATSASTVVFDGGNTSAKFVRAASGIINETNRVGLNNTTQNPWSPFEVWLQFRPLTGPSGTGSPTPNSACDSTTVTAPFTWSNSGPNSLSGTTSSGYFIGSNPYNVCVYYTHNFSLTLLANAATSTSLNMGEHVVYTGTYLYGATPIVGAPITITVWNGFGCLGPALYSGISGGNTDSTGNYYFDGGPSPFGVYSVMANTTAPANQSNCVDITVHDYALTMLANGSTSGVSYNGQDVTYSGVETDGPNPIANDLVTLTVWSGHGCLNAPAATVSATTDSTGTYSYDAGQAGVGEWSIQASTTNAISACLDLTELPNYAMTLLANGSNDATVALGGPITYTGTFTYNGAGLNAQSIDMTLYTSPGCTGAVYSSFPGVATTDSSGDFQWGPNANTQAGISGVWYLIASSGAQQSNCITVSVS